jgi:glycosyltransferase involved in cell wall biosynthesis
MGENWNNCVDYATGDYIMLLSADDLLLPKFVETAISTFDKNDIDAFSSNHLLLNSQMERERRVTIKEQIYENFTSLILLKNPFSINFTLFSKDAITQMKLLNKGKLFKSYYTCDYDLWIRSSNHLKIYFSNTILGKYRLHDSNLSNNKKTHAE